MIESVVWGFITSTSARNQMDACGFLFYTRIFICYLELIHHLIGFRRYYMLITQIQRGLFWHWTSWYGQNTHPCDIVGSIGTEILRLVVGLNLPIVDSSNCFNEIDQSSSFERRRLINKLIVNKRPNSLVLMHMRSNVEINHPLSIKLSGKILI